MQSSMMETGSALVLGVGAAAAFAAPAQAAVEWDTFVVRQGGGGLSPVTAVEDADGNGATALIDESGDKAAYGTDDFDGQLLSSITKVSYTRLDAGTKNPYLNFWVTDGTGNFAVIAPNTLNAEKTAIISSDFNGLNLADLGVAIYETNLSDLNWIATGARQKAGSQMLVDANDKALTMDDLGFLKILDPGVYPNPPVGAGAAKNHGGLAIIFGDLQGNYTNPVPYQIDNVIVTVPEPASLALLALGGVAAAMRRRK